VAGGGFAPPLSDRDDTQAVTEVPPQQAAGEPPVATATPQVEPSTSGGG
jgi:hypothetical protein